MPFLIDGDNLLGTWRGRSRSDAERRKLAMQLGRFGARERRKVVVVFDGPSPPSVAYGTNVQFAGHGRSADDVILEQLRRENDPKGWTVVTSDRSLGDQCRYVGARIEKCDRFRIRLGRRNVDEKPEREEDIDYWLEQFGEE
ncbi:MAG: NYN domain-containing protein [bacterium]|nr:NYN domain-containing protein [bacterium]